MGTQAYWMKSGWRWRALDRETLEPEGRWLHARTLADIKEDFAESSAVRAEVQKFDGRRGAEMFVPNSRLVKGVAGMRRIMVSANSEEG